MKRLFILPMVVLAFFACKKESKQQHAQDEGPQLIFKVKLDSTQQRLDQFGQPQEISAGNAAQNPRFNWIALHSIELVPNEYTPFEQGDMIYFADYVMEGGMKSIVFDKLKQVKNGEIVFKIPIKDVVPGTYKYIRSSVACQNYDFDFQANNFNMVGTISSFVGHMTYITSYKIKSQTVNVNASKMQGYYGVEIPAIPPYYSGEVIQGQTPSTTVVNPISQTSPLPSGSCTVTGTFPQPFTITGNEKNDVVIDLSFSINKSFEWKDPDGNGIYNPLDGDTVVDMGLRGLIPIVH